MRSVLEPPLLPLEPLYFGTPPVAPSALCIDPDDGLARYNVACFCSLVGEHQRAIDLLHLSETVAAETARENERLIPT